jgi:hypothetical protein
MVPPHFFMFGHALGSVCKMGGIVLYLHHITASTSWTGKFMGSEGKISDAVLGAILFIVGLLL